MVQTILPILQTLLAFFNICIILFGFYKFLGKPRDTLEKRVSKLETRVDEHDRKIKSSDDDVQEIKEASKVMQTCTLALIDFELSYCTNTNYEHTEDLFKAKDTLRGYLERK